MELGVDFPKEEEMSQLETEVRFLPQGRLHPRQEDPLGLLRYLPYLDLG